MYKPNKMYIVTSEPTGDLLAQFRFPVVFRIQESNGNSYDVTYDANGKRTVLKDTDTGYDDEIALIYKEIETRLKKPNTENDGTFENILLINENGDTAYASFRDISQKTTEFVVSKSAGNFSVGDVFPGGLTIDQAFIRLLTGVYYPSFTNPSFSLSHNLGSVREIGEKLTLTLTGNFNRGSINGNIVNQIWNPTSSQNPRSGVPSSYTLNGVTQINNSVNIDVIVKSGTNSFSGSVDYLVGPQPLASNGENFDFPLPKGKLNATTSFGGYYKRFYGITDTEVVNNPRELSFSFDNASKTFIMNTGNKSRFFHLFLPPGRDLENVFDLDALNANIKSQYKFQGNQTISDGGGNNVVYKYYLMKIDIPYDTNHRHEITLK